MQTCPIQSQTMSVPNNRNPNILGLPRETKKKLNGNPINNDKTTGIEKSVFPIKEF